MISVRIVNVDYYMCYPIINLDVKYSEFRGIEVRQVPVIQIYGSSQTGHKTCLNIHGVFPYIYIPYDGSEPAGNLSYKIATELDKALNISLGQAASNTVHIHNIVLVSGIPIYGFHERKHQFFKIYFYNPAILKKASSLLENGAILGKRFQPHETHINYILQFMIDYNLHGMSFINISRAMYRLNENDPDLLDNIPSDMKLGNDILRRSICKFELDVLASDITNKDEISSGNLAINPGIAALWEDERQRRRNKEMDSQISFSLTQHRENIRPTTSHLFFEQKLANKLLKEYKDDDSLDKSVYPAETPEDAEVLNASEADFSVLDPTSLDETIKETQFDENDVKLLAILQNLKETTDVEDGSILSQQIQEPDISDHEEDQNLNNDCIGENDSIWENSFWDECAEIPDHIPQIDGHFDSDSSDIYQRNNVEPIIRSEIEYRPANEVYINSDFNIPENMKLNPGLNKLILTERKPNKSVVGITILSDICIKCAQDKKSDYKSCVIDDNCNFTYQKTQLDTDTILNDISSSSELPEKSSDVLEKLEEDFMSIINCPENSQTEKNFENDKVVINDVNLSCALSPEILENFQKINENKNKITEGNEKELLTTKSDNEENLNECLTSSDEAELHLGLPLNLPNVDSDYIHQLDKILFNNLNISNKNSLKTEEIENSSSNCKELKNNVLLNDLFISDSSDDDDVIIFDDDNHANQKENICDINNKIGETMSEKNKINIENVGICKENVKLKTKEPNFEIVNQYNLRPNKVNKGCKFCVNCNKDMKVKCPKSNKNQIEKENVEIEVPLSLYVACMNDNPQELLDHLYKLKLSPERDKSETQQNEVSKNEEVTKLEVVVSINKEKDEMVKKLPGNEIDPTEFNTNFEEFTAGDEITSLIDNLEKILKEDMPEQCFKNEEPLWYTNNYVSNLEDLPAIFNDENISDKPVLENLESNENKTENTVSKDTSKNINDLSIDQSDTNKNKISVKDLDMCSKDSENLVKSEKENDNKCNRSNCNCDCHEKNFKIEAKYNTDQKSYKLHFSCKTVSLFEQVKKNVLHWANFYGLSDSPSSASTTSDDETEVSFNFGVPPPGIRFYNLDGQADSHSDSTSTSSVSKNDLKSPKVLRKKQNSCKSVGLSKKSIRKRRKIKQTCENINKNDNSSENTEEIDNAKEIIENGMTETKIKTDKVSCEKELQIVLVPVEFCQKNNSETCIISEKPQTRVLRPRNKTYSSTDSSETTHLDKKIKTDAVIISSDDSSNEHIQTESSSSLIRSFNKKIVLCSSSSTEENLPQKSKPIRRRNLRKNRLSTKKTEISNSQSSQNSDDLNKNIESPKLSDKLKSLKPELNINKDTINTEKQTINRKKSAILNKPELTNIDSPKLSEKLKSVKPESNINKNITNTEKQTISRKKSPVLNKPELLTNIESSKRSEKLKTVKSELNNDKDTINIEKQTTSRKKSPVLNKPELLTNIESPKLSEKLKTVKSELINDKDTINTEKQIITRKKSPVVNNPELLTNIESPKLSEKLKTVKSELINDKDTINTEKQIITRKKSPVVNNPELLTNIESPKLSEKLKTVKSELINDKDTIYTEKQIITRKKSPVVNKPELLTNIESPKLSEKLKTVKSELNNDKDTINTEKQIITRKKSPVVNNPELLTNIESPKLSEKLKTVKSELNNDKDPTTSEKQTISRKKSPVVSKPKLLTISEEIFSSVKENSSKKLVVLLERLSPKQIAQLKRPVEKKDNKIIKTTVTKYTSQRKERIYKVRSANSSPVKGRRKDLSPKYSPLNIIRSPKKHANLTKSEFEPVIKKAKNEQTGAEVNTNSEKIVTRSRAQLGAGELQFIPLESDNLKSDKPNLEIKSIDTIKKNLFNSTVIEEFKTCTYENSSKSVHVDVDFVRQLKQKEELFVKELEFNCGIKRNDQNISNFESSLNISDNSNNSDHNSNNSDKSSLDLLSPKNNLENITFIKNSPTKPVRRIVKKKDKKPIPSTVDNLDYFNITPDKNIAFNTSNFYSPRETLSQQNEKVLSDIDNYNTKFYNLTVAELYDLKRDYAPQPSTSKMNEEYEESSPNCSFVYNDISLMDNTFLSQYSQTNSNIWMPKYLPPSQDDIKNSLEIYNIPENRFQEPFYSEYSDVTGKVNVGHNVLKISSTATIDFELFESSIGFGIEKWRKKKFKEFCSPEQILKNLKITLATCKKNIITPVNLPPTRAEIESWIRMKTNETAIKQIEKVEKPRILIPQSPGNESLNDSLTLSPCTPVSSISSPKSSQESTPTSSQCSINSKRRPKKRGTLQKKVLFSQSKLVNITENHSGNDITGVTLDNTHGFQMSFENLQDVKTNSEHQFLTILVVELHIRTRGDFFPDPQYDSIRALFYSILNDVPENSLLPNKETGIIVVDTLPGSPVKETEPLLHGTGIDCELNYVKSETDLINEFVKLIRKWDPDIFVGFEIEMLSWGYLIDRCNVIGINLPVQISRTNPEIVRNKTGENRQEELRLNGRIILDAWRLFRHEIALQSYTFENLMFHILHQRIPAHSFKNLSFWWEYRSNYYRYITVNYYITRVDGILKLLYQLDLIGRTSELARLFGIQFYEVLSRGSQFRVESMMLRLAKPLNFIPVSPNVQQRAKMRAPESLPLILEPESRFYVDPVIVLDFQSLYPSIIIAYNYCYSTCVGRVEKLGTNSPFEFGACQLKLPKSRVDKLQGKINFSPCGVGFVKPEVRQGILPRMLKEILETRLMVKSSMKENKENKILQRVLHNRQLGLKLIANVTYGYTSANFSGRMPCIEVGDSVVSKGRETLERAIHMIETTDKWRARVVYGDTDSLFVLVPGRSREDAFKIGAEIAEAVTNDNPPPVKLKLEKVYQPCILQTKKRYVGYMYESPEQKEPEYNAKGIETVRRDGCPAVAKMLEKTLRLLFETRDVSLVKRYVTRQFEKLITGRASIQDLTFAREFRGFSGYRPGACVPALELTKKWMAVDKRREPRRSERVPYIVVHGPPGLPLIRLVKCPRELLNPDQGVSLRPNAVYYITKVIAPALNRCLGLIGADVLAWYNEMPRKQLHIIPTDIHTETNKKSTISQYFATMSCIVCNKQTRDGLCEDCINNPQNTVVVLQEKLRHWERSYDDVQQICKSCCGRVEYTNCTSLDCPVLYRLSQTKKDLKQVPFVRNLLSRF